MCMLELNLEKKQASPPHTPPHKQAMKKAKEENITHKKQLIPIMD